MAGLAGSPLSGAILGRVKAADFLVWLDEAADEVHEGVAHALHSMGFPMCSRPAGPLPTDPQSNDTPPSLGMGLEPLEAASDVTEPAEATSLAEQLGEMEPPPAIEAFDSPEAALFTVSTGVPATVPALPLREGAASPAAPHGGELATSCSTAIERPEAAARGHALLVTADIQAAPASSISPPFGAPDASSENEVSV